MPGPSQPAVPVDVRTRTVRSGGVSLAVAEAGEPGRPTILMIHGYPDTKEVWEPVMARLAPDFHVVAYDVRGAGASSAPRPAAAYDLARLGDDFAAVRAAVAPEEPIHLVGHDWGGIQGWEFVADPRFAGAIASFTSIAGPALAHASWAIRGAARRREWTTALDRARRSWYIVPLCLPGGPQLAWRVVLGGRRWRRCLELEGVPTDGRYPSPTVCADGLHGARLYRRNIARRLVGGGPPLAPALAPVQLILPAGDRLISSSYYDAAGRVAPGLRRRVIPGSHWAIRTEPARVAAWIAEFVRSV